MSKQQANSRQNTLPESSKKYIPTLIFSKPSLSTNEITFIDSKVYPTYWYTQPAILYSTSFTNRLVDFDTSEEFTHFLLPYSRPSTLNIKNLSKLYPMTLKQFFILQNVDTPSLLKQPRSKFRSQFVTPVAQLVGMLSKHGLHRKIWINYLWVYRTVIQQLMFPGSSSHQFSSIRTLLNFFELKTFTKTKQLGYNDLQDKTPWCFNHQLSGDIINFNSQSTLNLFFFTFLKKYIPIFAMKTQKVDKMKFKHSRGKSGKYSVSWKYIPRYKRLSIVLRWLVEDITLQKAPTFRAQMLKSHQILFTAPSTSLLHKNRTYVHNYVYSRYRNTLLRSLKKTH